MSIAEPPIGCHQSAAIVSIGFRATSSSTLGDTRPAPTDSRRSASDHPWLDGRNPTVTRASSPLVSTNMCPSPSWLVSSTGISPPLSPSMRTSANAVGEGRWRRSSVAGGPWLPFRIARVSVLVCCTPLGYEQADRRPSPFQPVARAPAGLSQRHRAVSACLTTSGPFRGVLVTITVTEAASWSGRTANRPAGRLAGRGERPGPVAAVGPWSRDIGRVRGAELCAEG